MESRNLIDPYEMALWESVRSSTDLKNFMEVQRGEFCKILKDMDRTKGDNHEDE